MTGEARTLGHLLARPALWLIVALLLIGTTAAYQVRHTYTVDVGRPGDALYLRNFHDPASDPATGRSYRPTDAYGYVVLPGLGGGVPYSLTLTLNPGATTTPVTILVNGAPLFERRLAAGWHDYTLSVDAGHPDALTSRDLVVEIRAAPRGIAVARLEVGPAGPGFVAPAYLQLGYLVAILLLSYLLLGRLAFLAARGRARRLAVRSVGALPADATRAHLVLSGAVSRLPLLGAALVGAVLVALVALVHLPLTASSGYLVGGLLAAHALLLVAPPVLAWLAPEARLALRLLARPAPWAIAALAVLAAVAAFQVRHAYDIDVGSPADQAYVQNFHDRDADSGRSFRAGGVYSYVSLPGVGGDVPYSLTLTMRAAHPGIPVTVLVDGEPVLQAALPNQWQSYTVAIDAAHPQALASRDLVVELRTPASFNLQVDRVQVTPAGPGFVAPAYRTLAFLAAVVLLTHLLLARVLAPPPAPAAAGAGGGASTRAALIPAAGAAVAGAVLVALLAAVHLPLTVALPHLVTTGVLTYGVLLLAEPVARRLAPEGARAAAGLVAGAFLVRFGLMALPESVIIDMPYHLKWMHELLAGNVAALTDPHGGLNQPPREWNLAIIIPKSPLFYFVAAPLAWIPGDLQTALTAFVCLLEASTVLFCYALAARFAPAFGGWRAGLGAAFVYAAMPLGFRALAYGILPTILAQWLSVAFFTGLLFWARRVGREQWPALSTQHTALSTRYSLRAGLLVLLTAALIAFPTIAVFDTVVAGGVALTWWVRRARRPAAVLLGGLGVAWGLAIAGYYGVYLTDLFTRALPALLGARPAAAGQPAATAGASTVHWTGPLDLLGWTVDYLVSALPLLMGLAGLAGLWWAHRHGTGGRPERLWAGLSAWWMAVLPIFVVVNYRFDMIGKHLYYTMVPLAVGSGIFLWGLWRRGAVARLWAGLLAGALLWMALAFWIERLVRASS